MIKNTMTIISNLKPGDIFCRPGYAMKYRKTDGGAVMINKHLYGCHAVPITGEAPRPFFGTEEVIYLGKSCNINRHKKPRFNPRLNEINFIPSNQR